MCTAIESANLRKNNKWYLKLKTVDRTYLLSADTEKEMNKWLRALRAAQDEVKAGGQAATQHELPKGIAAIAKRYYVVDSNRIFF